LILTSTVWPIAAVVVVDEGVSCRVPVGVNDPAANVTEGVADPAMWTVAVAVGALVAE
jgi:hypothetical protein